MRKQLPKIYEPQKFENDIYKRWEESGYFNPDKCLSDGIADENKPHFSMVLPPPNVTGRLHAGHAVMVAIEDVLTRFNRMQGKPTLWIPGTDHAAIATQTKVEKLIFEKYKKTRHDLGREEFLKKVEQFAKESHDTIVMQTKKLGSSLDWSREAYTLDKERNFAVRTAFKKMFDDGLIYRGERVVNWCPHCNSTLADDEVEYKKQNAKLYTFKYDRDFPIEISTTRPETKLADTAIAVNPKDERYAKYIGKTFPANFCGINLEIKIIADRNVDMEFGTGALGVTPAHSMIDWQMAQNNSLPIIKVIDENANIKEGFGEFSGKSAIEAREMIIEKLNKQELISKEEEIENNLSICYRCGTSIEPLPSLQWFINVNKKINVKDNKIVPPGIEEASLKELMLFAVNQNHISIVPDNFTKIYFHWIENLQDWCISRQIWFGHRIPVWYRNEELYCGVQDPQGEGWQQDPDTLDTWFSSGLWTFSTLGWPNKTKDFDSFHPTTLLETGYDILFFWVARMILMTTYLIGDVPFKNVYLHGLVRDEKGRKMSKSLGNIIDPLDVIEKYGTDSLRLALMIGSTPGHDLKLSEEKIESFRNFTNKLWNISRYILMSVENIDEKINIEKLKPSDIWVMKEMSSLIEDVTSDIENFRISQAGEKLREFTWNIFADWFIEIAKFEENKFEKEWLLKNILEDLLKLWHPFTPFVTEAIWKEMGKEKLLLIEKWPVTEKYNLRMEDWRIENNTRYFELVQQTIIAIRNIRIENKIDSKEKITAIIRIKKTGNQLFKDVLESEEEIIKKLRTGIEKLTIETSDEVIEDAYHVAISDGNIYVLRNKSVDVEKEKARIKKEIEKKERFIDGLKSRLSNNDFVSKAPKSVIDHQTESLKKTKIELDSLKKQLGSLK